MLSLQSDRWITLTSSVSGNGQLALGYLQAYLGGDTSSLDELSAQCCHQFSLGNVAFAVVPHLVHGGQNVGLDQLYVIGNIRASELRSGVSPPIDLVDDYRGALDTSLLMALEILKTNEMRPGDVKRILAFVSAVKGDYNLSIHLLLNGGSDHELSCPHCGEYIKW